MICTLRPLLLVGALIAAASPAFAEKEFDTQVGKFDLDPFDLMAPRDPAPPAAAPKKHHHKMKHHMKKM